MARIEWVDQRLRNWALWHERQRGGGLGYATQVAWLADPADRGGYREAHIPVDDVEAGITDEAVQTLQSTHSHLHRTVTAIYLDEIGVKETARVTGRAESTIHAQLGQADQVLALWFNDRKRRKEGEAEAMRQQLQRAQSERLQAVVLPPPPLKRRSTRGSFTP